MKKTTQNHDKRYSSKPAKTLDKMLVIKTMFINHKMINNRVVVNVVENNQEKNAGISASATAYMIRSPPGAMTAANVTDPTEAIEQ